MTTTTLGSTRFIKKGQYSGTAVYLKDDVVLFNGAWYLCTQDTVAGILPTNTSYFTVWQSLWNWRGQHNNVSTPYSVGDIVYYLTNYTTGSTTAGTFTRQSRQVYRCIQAHTSNNTTTFLPINNTYWTVINNETYHDGTVSIANANITEKWGVIGSDPEKVLIWANQGRVGENVDSLKLGTNKCNQQSYDWNCFITQSGQVRMWGRGASASGMTYTNNTGNSIGPSSITPSYFFHDFFRSTSNGGAGVHSTPDGKMPRCVQIETGYDWWTALFNNGEVYCGGYGGNGENGNRASSNRFIARPGGTYTEVAVAANTTSHIFRDTRIIMISSSGGSRPSSAHHNLALDETGTVWAWGYNAYGQLGDNSVTSKNYPVEIPKAQFGLTGSQKVVAIWASGGEYGYSFALTDQNKLWAWGYNNYGQLGLGVTSTNVRIPTEVTTQTWTAAGAGTIKKLINADSSTGTFYSCTAILTSKGAVYNAGWNGQGHMMKGDTAQANSFLVCTSGPGSNNTATDVWLTSGHTPSMWVKDNQNRLYAAGSNQGGQLGIAGTNSNYTTAQQCQKSVNGVMSNLTNVKTMTALGGGSGGTNTCAIVTTNDGWSYAAGNNGYGQLSLGWSGSYHYSVTDNADRENTAQRGFQMVKMPPAVAGNVDYAWICGRSDSASTAYHHPVWVTTYGQVYQAGYNAAYSISGHNNSNHRNVMVPVSIS